MAVDVQALKDAPPDDDRALVLLEECRSRLGGEWRLVRSSIKLSKAFFEAEYNGRPVIGKVSGSKRASTAFGSLRALRAAGLRPPLEYTVPEPIAWFEDRQLLVLEKAPGAAVTDDLELGNKAAEWLMCLQSLQVDLRPARFAAAAAHRRAAELAGAVNEPGLPETATEAISILATAPAALVPSHGDYHPMNIYVAPGRVTVIDLDTVAAREPEADIGYFLAQAANFGLLMFDSLEATRALRDTFLRSFPATNQRRLAAHMAWALLQSLHYDACILKIKNDKAGLMVKAATAALKSGSLDPAGA